MPVLHLAKTVLQDLRRLLQAIAVRGFGQEGTTRTTSIGQMNLLMSLGEEAAFRTEM